MGQYGDIWIPRLVVGILGVALTLSILVIGIGWLEGKGEPPNSLITIVTVILGVLGVMYPTSRNNFGGGPPPPHVVTK